MSRVRKVQPGGPPSGDLRTLKALVLDALNELGRTLVTPALAADGASIMWAQTTSSSPSRSSFPSRRGGSGPRHAAGRPADAAAPGDDDQQEMADEHIEIWRLVERAQAGDGEAFGQLYDRYVDTVFRFIYFRVNDRALAEDFTSETFLRALRRIGSISYQGRDIGAWFVTIARNIVLDHMKSARHRLEYTTADTIEGDDRAPSPETAVLEQLTNERLMAAVAQLGDEQRECVMLRFIQGFSVSETAAVMGKNDGAIKALQHRAVRKLADLVGGELR
jgi:RNA polymerase sigma-70 factor, ECF subfamily